MESGGLSGGNDNSFNPASFIFKEGEGQDLQLIKNKSFNLCRKEMEYIIVKTTLQVEPWNLRKAITKSDYTAGKRNSKPTKPLDFQNLNGK